MSIERKSVFRLYACCIPVRGAARSTICDLQNERYFIIPNALFEILTDHRDQSRQEIEDLYGNDFGDIINGYFSFLIEHDLGFWCDEPDLFPILDLTWERPEPVTNAIIDIDENSDHNFHNIFTQLSELRCKAVQIRFYCSANTDLIQGLLLAASKSTIRSIELMIKYDLSWSKDAALHLCDQHPRISALYFHSALEDHVEYSNNGIPLLYFCNTIDSPKCCGEINAGSFAPTILCFAESQKYNSCLNRKISVDAAGEIKNCPSQLKSYGNIRHTRLQSALESDGFKSLWSISKDQVEVCRDCEFRYICTDCRALITDHQNIYSKPLKCTYNPYTAQWE